jgi:hypothetical protein
MSVLNSGFENTLTAAADYLGTGAIEVPMYDSEIKDIVRRKSTFLTRVKKEKSTGYFHRYFEQTDIATAAFADPRAMNPSATGPTRQERPVAIKALVAKSTINLIDKLVTEQQGQFESVIDKDIIDITNAVVRTSANAVWNGTDTSLSVPTTLQYMGLLKQITQTVTVAPGASIIDALKTTVATMTANTTFDVMPTAIYVNPVLNDAIDQEAKAAHMTVNQAVVGAGVTVNVLNSQAGSLPLISEPYIPFTGDTSYGFPAPPAGYKNYFAVILTEEWVVMPYISGKTDNPYPMLFQLGLQNDISGQYVAVKFDSVFAIGPSYAHAIVCVQLPV